MSVFEIIVYLLLGILFLFIGAEGVIRGGSNLAIKMGVAPLVVGLTVVAFGTSAPELVVSLNAALKGNATISLGNVIGSNIANIALILGVASLIKPIKVNAKVIIREIPILIGLSVLLFILLLDGEISFAEGIGLVVALVVYNIVTVLMAKKEKNLVVKLEYEKGLTSKYGRTVSIILMIVGLALLILGANLFVEGAVAIAKLFDLSDAIIGLTIVAIGTSLPELITSIVATMKGESDIAVGNAVGSNVFNILGILGITALVIPISSEGISYIDLGVMILTAIILFAISRTGLLITRLEGALLFIGYICYVYYLLPK